MQKMRLLFLSLFFSGLFAVVSYLDHDSQKHFETISPLSLSDEEIETAAKKEKLTMTLQQVLITTEKIDGYDVEVYEEYEVYKNEKGEVVDRVATGYYQTLRYKDASDSEK
ncbi:hypothetical protein FZC66_07100 [Priestia megaterium]|nr:hypothetical protein FZC66_07100 [Priestia megaterium]